MIIDSIFYLELHQQTHIRVRRALSEICKKNEMTDDDKIAPGVRAAPTRSIPGVGGNGVTLITRVYWPPLSCAPVAALLFLSLPCYYSHRDRRFDLMATIDAHALHAWLAGQRSSGHERTTSRLVRVLHGHWLLVREILPLSLSPTLGVGRPEGKPSSGHW